MVIESAPPTSFSSFLKFEFFLLEVRGRVQSVLLPKPLQRLAELSEGT